MNEAWGTYLPALTACILKTLGPILEVGAGWISTPVLEALRKGLARDVLVIEDTTDWALKVGTDPSEYDKVLPGLAHSTWSVVFLDHSPGSRRAADALLFKDSAEFIVVHDYEAADVAGPFEPILKEWQYNHVDFRFTPHTLVLGRSPI